MSTLKPTSIKRPKPNLLEVKWSDGYEAVVTLEKVREGCPCADCTNAHGTKPTGPNGMKGMDLFKQFKPGMNELTALKAVGNYAVQCSWADGHDSGIYTWPDLREICEKNKLSDEKLSQMGI